MGSIICLILLLNKEDWGEGWLCQALFGSLFIALECATHYFLLKGLAYVLDILMEWSLPVVWATTNRTCEPG